MNNQPKIGHVADFDAIALDNAKHFAFRLESMTCPVVQFCRGSCMFLAGISSSRVALGSGPIDCLLAA